MYFFSSIFFLPEPLLITVQIEKPVESPCLHKGITTYLLTLSLHKNGNGNKTGERFSKKKKKTFNHHKFSLLQFFVPNVACTPVIIHIICSIADKKF